MQPWHAALARINAIMAACFLVLRLKQRIPFLRIRCCIALMHGFTPFSVPDVRIVRISRAFLTGFVLNLKFVLIIIISVDYYDEYVLSSTPIC